MKQALINTFFFLSLVATAFFFLMLTAVLQRKISELNDKVSNLYEVVEIK